MKLFQKVAICVITVVASLFALAGCEGAGDGNTGNNGYNGEDSSGVLESGLVIATAPIGLDGKPFVGDFTSDGEVVCTNVSVCKFEATGVVEIEFTRSDSLFLNKYATANPDKDQEVYWDKPGDWGLAPQGVYTCNNGVTLINCGTYTVKTEIENEIRLYAFGLEDDGVTVHGSDLLYNDKDAGNISGDLTIITLVGLEDTFVLTLVE